MPKSPEKLDLASLDVAADKRRLLQRLFPEAVTETTDAHGRDQVAVDFDKLKAVLGEHAQLAAPGQERYGLEWPGKRDALKAVQAPSLATLIPAPDESVDWDTTRNVFIEGDNLEVLKLLQKSYYGQVKMIYIDPPYNTGNDFVYPDNYAESLDTYLRYTGQIDDQGFKTTTNSKDSGRFHSNWLRMMYPRLYVAKNLLREDGVIFISIDDNEVSNLRHMCDQIFGEENFQALISWQKRYTRSNNTRDFTTVIEHILVYSKTIDFTVNLLPRTDDADDRYTNTDGDSRGPWKGSSFLNPATPSQRPNLCYPIENPNTHKITLPTTNAWRRSESEFRILQQNDLLYWGKNGDLDIPSIKMFLSEARGLTPINFWDHQYAGNTDDGTAELQSLFDSKVFDFPKPSVLIRRILEHSTECDDLIVDFFAGSAPTAHAVMALNVEDGGKRRCISVQLPEPCESDCEAHKAGYKTIADIAKERMRRAGAKIRKEWEAKNASREAAKARSEEQKSQDLFSKSKPLRDFAPSREAPLSSSSNPQSPIPDPQSSSPPDLGFRVFKLAPSNFKRWDGEAAAASKDALVQQMEATLDHIATGATEESLLFEILLKAGYQLTCPLEQLTLAGHAVWSVDGGSLFVCVEDRIDSALIEAVAESHPVQFICLDRALQGNDPLKVNTLETFRAAQPEIQFRTV